MTRVWLGAILLCLAGIVAILALPGAQIVESRQERFSQAIRQLDPAPDVLVLGSSLSMLAFPSEFRVGDTPGPDTPAQYGLRMAVSCARPKELARMLKGAVARGIPRIFVEINHMLYSMKPCHAERGLRASLTSFALALRLRIKWTVQGTGAVLVEAGREPVGLKQIYDGDTSELGRYYPAKLLSPKAFDVLEPVMAEGRRNGVEVTLVAMPRSETALRFLGDEFNTGYDASLAALRARFSNRVWEPARFWPDHYFADHAHMNLAGRARFLAEFEHLFGETK